MKKPPQKFTSRDVDALLLLRYGRLVTSPQKYAILSLAQVARLAKISITSVSQLIKGRFSQDKSCGAISLKKTKRRAHEQPRKRFGPSFITGDEVRDITSQATLDFSVGLSQKERVLRHRMYWPFSRVNLC